MATLALIVSIASFVQSRKAGTLSKAANTLSQTANTVAGQARSDALAAPAEAERRQVYREIREHFTRLYQGLNDAWAYDNSHPLGQPPEDFLDTIAQARKLHDDVPKGGLWTSVGQGLHHFEHLHGAWQRMGTAEENHARLEDEVRLEDNNTPSFAKVSLAEERHILSDRRREMQAAKDVVDSAMDNLKPGFQNLIYKKD